MRMTIPNILTLMRIVLIPIFIVVYYLPVEWALVAATVIYFIAGITDWFDGYLARRMNETSAFGAFLDPVADKLMVVTAVILIVGNNPTEYSVIWLAIPGVIVVGREIIISALREWMAEAGAAAAVKVKMVGKVKTAAQMWAMGFLIYKDNLWGMPVPEIGLSLFYLAAFLTLWSMIDYLIAAWPALSEAEQKSARQGKQQA